MPTACEVEIANARESWFDAAHSIARKRPAERFLSTHGLLLQLDVRRAFIAGAWASVIVMAQAVIEATLRDLGTKDYEAKAKKLFEGDAELDRIRSIRNELVHPQAAGTPSLIWVGGYAASHAALENDAKRAVELMVKAIYAHY